MVGMCGWVEIAMATSVVFTVVDGFLYKSVNRSHAVTSIVLESNYFGNVHMRTKHSHWEVPLIRCHQIKS